jgi:hypothetical protein
MIYISHRGNLRGPNPEYENTPDCIDVAILLGYDVEIDLWGVGSSIYLGHDSPTTAVTMTWLAERQESLWIHCKNPHGLEIMTKSDFNYFFHNKDGYTLTSKGFVWAYPGMPPAGNRTIAVMPEMADNKKLVNLYNYYGVCSDFIGVTGYIDNHEK